MWRKRHFQFLKITSSRSGFTLIELMIVVAVISILAVIALPKFGRMVQKAREARTKGNLGALRSAISIYYGDNDGFFPQQERDLDDGDSAGINDYESSWTMGAVAPDMVVGHFIPTMVPTYIDEIPVAAIGQPWIGVAGRNKEGTSLVGSYNSKTTNPTGANLRKRGPDTSWLWEVWAYNCETGDLWVNADSGMFPMYDTRGEAITNW